MNARRSQFTSLLIIAALPLLLAVVSPAPAQNAQDVKSYLSAHGRSACDELMGEVSALRHRAAMVDTYMRGTTNIPLYEAKVQRIEQAIWFDRPLWLRIDSRSTKKQGEAKAVFRRKYIAPATAIVANGESLEAQLRKQAYDKWAKEHPEEAAEARFQELTRRVTAAEQEASRARSENNMLMNDIFLLEREISILRREVDRRNSRPVPR